MDQKQKLTIYEAQTKNAQAVESACKQVRRTINRALRVNDTPSVNTIAKSQIDRSALSDDFSEYLDSVMGSLQT